jgi:hypothetical protein
MNRELDQNALRPLDRLTTMTSNAKRQKAASDHTQKPIAFLDIEASGLDGYPIEIGWAIPDIGAGRMVVRSMLLRPPSAWNIAECWDEAAEKLHRISIDDLARDGQGPDAILLAMNAELAGYRLATDAPAWDVAWLRHLVEASAYEPAFEIAPQNALTLIGEAARARGWSPEGFAKAISGLEADYPHTHRAGPDAARLAALWLAANQSPPPPEHPPINHNLSRARHDPND